MQELYKIRNFRQLDTIMPREFNKIRLSVKLFDIYRLIVRIQLLYVRFLVRHNKLKLTDSVIVGGKFTCSAPIYPVWMMQVRP